MTPSTPTDIPRQLQRAPDVEGLGELLELALDLRWSWSHAIDELWNTRNARLRALTRNSWIVLQAVSHNTLRCCLANADFSARLDTPARMRHGQLEAPAWFQQTYSFRAAVPTTRCADDYTARATPCIDMLRVALEDARVRWQR